MSEEVSTKEKNLSLYLKALPLITGIVIVLGLTKQYLYFKYFDVNIIPFLSLSELGLLISDEILNIIILSLAYILLSNIGGESSKAYNFLHKYLKSKSGINNSPKIIKDIDNESEDGEPTKSKTNYTPFVIGTIIIPFYIFYQTAHKPDVKITLGIFIVCLLILNLLLSNISYLIKLLSFEGLMALIIIIGITLFISNSTVSGAEKAAKGQYIGTEISTKDTTYISTKENFYIGRTSNFIFIKNSKQNNITIIPNSEIIRFTVNEITLPKKGGDRPNEPPTKP